MIAWGGRIQNTEFRGQELRTPNPKLRTPTGAEWVETKFRWSRAANMRMYREEGWLMKLQLLVAGAVATGLFVFSTDATAHGGFSGGGGGGHGGRGGPIHAGGGFHGGGFHGGGFHGGGFHGGRFGDFHDHHGDFHGHRRFDHDRFFVSGFGFYGYPYWWDWGYPYYAYDDPYYYPYYYPGSYYGYDAYYGDPNYRTGDNRSYGAKAIQTELARRGYYRGPIDGVLGPESRNAIRSFQARNGLPVTGRVDGDLYRALRS
jgi:hypothetical protein